MGSFCPHYSCRMRVLLRNGVIYANGPQPLTSMFVVDDRIVWIGTDHAGFDADHSIDLDGRVVVPAFVDAHVHTTAIGLEVVDCAAADPAAVLDGFRPRSDVVIGHGWDDTHWPPDWFDLAGLDARVGNSLVYASRIDVHSAFVSSALLALVPRELDGWSETGVLTRAAHAWARDLAYARLTDTQRSDAQRRALARAASLGIAAIQEMAGPQISSYRDAELLLAHRDAQLPDVKVWWGELHGHDAALRLGAYGLGGDLVIDGSLGSHTAALLDNYADDGSPGALYQDANELRTHIAEAVRVGLPTAFHAIGDAATQQVVSAFAAVAHEIGVDRLRAGRHRIEHCELITDDDLRTMADLGIIASVQPQFDACWGGDDEMYAQRLGRARAQRMNRFATMARTGVQLAFGSDAPVTPFDPWGGVHAAQFHRTDTERLTQRAAIAAHTRGGWRAVGVDDAGVLAEGWEATFAVWEHGGATTLPVDRRIARWSTDPRAGIPQLPDMRQARCVMTVRRGETLFDALG